MRISRRSLVTFAAALVLWSALALFMVTTRGGHICSLLQPVRVAGATEPLPQTDAEWAEFTHQRCDRPLQDFVGNLVIAAGYVVIVGAFVLNSRRPSA